MVITFSVRSRCENGQEGEDDEQEFDAQDFHVWVLIWF
jgi:hypothetical protein